MKLVETIQNAVQDGRFVVSIHARNRMAERKLKLWQIESGLKEGRVILCRPRSKPHSSIVVGQTLPDGTSVTVVWSWLPELGMAKLVTVYYSHKGVT